MATVHKVNGYDEFVSFIGDLAEKNQKSPINVYFTGNKLESGKSWCPDCNDGEQSDQTSSRVRNEFWWHLFAAEPFIQKYGIENGAPGSHFVIAEVGDRPTWVALEIMRTPFLFNFTGKSNARRYKDPKCPFRTDKNTHLSVIPTLINWNEKAKRLEGDQLCKPELLEMFFEQEWWPVDDGCRSKITETLLGTKTYRRNHESYSTWRHFD